MIELFEHKETTYLERANGDLVLGNSKPLKDKGNIEVTIGNETFLIPIGDNGIWRWEAPSTYADGNYSLSISHIDRAGNRSKPTLATIIVDSTPPEAPELLKLYDDFGADIGGFEPGDTTDDKRPTLTGIAQKGATVYLRDADGNNTGSAVADINTGKWVIEPMQDLKDGENSLTLVAIETFAGKQREGTPSSFNIIIGNDTGGGDETILPPGTIAISYAIDNEGINTGVLNHGALTDDTTPELRGIASANSTVIIYYREIGSDVWIGSETATINGQQWSWVPSLALNSGSYEFQASIGNTSSAPFSLHIANPTDLISKTIIEYAIDDVGVNTGLLTNGAITDDNAPMLHGRGEANSTLWLFYRNDKGAWSTLGTTTVMGDGSWAYQASTLLRGEYEFKALPINDANIENQSLSLKIIGEGANIPEISYANDNVGAYRGPIYSGDKTDDKTPEITGKAESNSIVFIEYQKSGGAWQTGYSVKTDTNGVWSIKNIPELTDGSWNFRAKSADTTGYSSEFKLDITRTVETSSYIEDFNDYPYQRAIEINSGEMLKIGKLSYDQSQYDLKVNSTGITYFGPNYYDQHFEYTIDLNYIAYSASFKAGAAQGGASNSYLYWSAYNTLGERVANGYEGGSATSWRNHLFRFESSGLSFNKIVFSGRYLTYIDDISIVTKGEPNPAATWMNESMSDVTTNDMSDLNNVSDYTLSLTNSKSEFLNGKDNVKADTLTLLTEKNIDLTLADESFDNIKTFDITGTGDNTLKLDLTALLQHGEKDLFIEDGKTQLMVKGNEGDVVELVDILPEGSDISEWQHQEGTITVAGVEYNVYSHGDDAELLVQQGVKTELV